MFEDINKTNSSNRFCVIGVMLVFLHSICFFDYVDYKSFNPSIYRYVSIGIGVFLLLFTMVNYYSLKTSPLAKYAIGFIFLPMLSFIPCSFCHEQSIEKSFIAYIPFFYFFIYFVLHKYKVRESDVIKWLTVIAIIRTTILIIEQFTYPDYYFAFRKEAVDALGRFHRIEQRAGIYRFYLRDTYLSMFLVFVYLQKIIEKIRISHVCIFLFGVVGVYFDQSRQYMFSTVLSISTILLFSSNIKYKYLYTFIIFMGLFFVYINADLLFDEMIERTNEEMVEENIRVGAYTFFGLVYWDGPLTKLFGNGFPDSTSAYGKEMFEIHNYMRFYQTDIGIVGMLSYYGIVSVTFFLSFFVYILKKFWKNIDLHLKFFILAAIINLPLFTMFSCHIDSYPFWAFMFYLIDKSIERNRILNCN